MSIKIRAVLWSFKSPKRLNTSTLAYSQTYSNKSQMRKLWENLRKTSACLMYAGSVFLLQVTAY
jgi:hypothetical protein